MVNQNEDIKKINNSDSDNSFIYII
jgi:hypothetical protein